jgi:hypothetical protein
MVEEAAISAVLSLATSPEQYDPGRLSLAGYLRMAARGDLLNARRSAARRARWETSLADVELAQRAENSLVEGPADPAEAVMPSQPLDSAILELLRATFRGRDRDVLTLILDGEHRTEVYAGVLGIGDLPQEVQAREVKRVKDRLKKQLRRLALRLPRDG